MRLTFTLIFFLTIFFAEAQTGAPKQINNLRKIENRLDSLEGQLKAYQQEFKKQNSTLDSLEKESLIIKAYQNGYSNNITVLTTVFSALLGVGLFVIGIIIPYFQKREFNSLIVQANQEFSNSITEAKGSIQLLEKNLKKETKVLELKNFRNTIETARLMMATSHDQLPNVDSYIYWSLELYLNTLEFLKAGGVFPNPGFFENLAMSYIDDGLNNTIKTFNNFELINKKINSIIEILEDKELVEKFQSIKNDYNKLYYTSLANPDNEDVKDAFK